ncbi:UBX domain-containing protein 7 [Tolypocladium ophioglossoides CBS 100239]|uniref:UBX domain-containing protein 2 n=1 Tax=Tolypocladium ophioglossoides (strain CBS 100239) TaxID=1163406 RepID=A0A0L0NFU9_TOLOC|nr:UBX domain-containing protein 7 [Tolypocladium ophioglossoides CBS 100239]
MFYQGSLQEGISTAVGQQKLVLCFVTNKNEESQQWEDEFLHDSSLTGLIQGQAVALRLEAGSDDAGYLAQIFPLPQTPTVVIMKHGELKEYISAGASKDEFIRRVQSAFNVSPAAAPHAGEPSPLAPQAEASSLSSSPQTDRSENVRRVLAERAEKLQAQKDEAERRAKEERAKAEDKAKAEAAARADTDAARTHTQAELLKKKRQQESEERKRILKRIEDDRTERHQRAAEREQKRIDGQKTGDIAASLVNAPETKLPSTTRVGEMASIQVRLFDGSTMRSRFKTAASFKDVRAWVDEKRTDGRLPYTFRQLLTPMPNKAIDEMEEGKSLGELGLAPSSTLILIPVQKFSSAYEGGSQSVLSRVIAAILGFFTWLMGLIGLGGNREMAQRPVAAGSERSSSSAQEKDRRIRGFQNPNDQRRDQQLYNGNSLNFEPRPDEDER